MKKTTEQIKNEIINYLTKVSNHTFMRNGQYFKVFKEYYNDEVIFKILENDKITIFDFNQYIIWYGSNAKNVISNRLFLHLSPDYKIFAIKNTKDVKNSLKELVEKV